MLAVLAVGTLSAPPARAIEPMLTFLFYMAREIMYEGFSNSEFPQPRQVEPLPAVYPGTMVEPSKLRDLIDQSFIYLSDGRRERLFQAFNAELVKPKNAAVRATMIAYFAEHALAVRTVMERLSKLNENEMRELSERFADQARTLSEEDRAKLRTVVEEGLLPVPADLNKYLVVAIADIPVAPVEDADAGADTAPGEAKPTGEGAPSAGPSTPSGAAAPLSKTAPASAAQTAAAPDFTQ